VIEGLIFEDFNGDKVVVAANVAFDNILRIIIINSDQENM
jgi:hypothetical protein